MTQRVTPFLWYEAEAETAARFYVSLFAEARILDASPMSVAFEIDGARFIAMNGGPAHRQTEAYSMFTACPDQAEVDRLWDAFLANGGTEGQCGWLKDRWGLSWQIIPDALGRYLSSPDRERAGRVVQAMLKMKRIDVAGLDAAWAGEEQETR